MITNNRIKIKETIANIMCDDSLFELAVSEIELRRSQLEEYIKKDNDFLLSLLPIAENDKMPEIAQKMCRASRIVNVGPMATVAGAISEYGVKKLIEHGADFGMVDNGGDISLITDRTVVIGIYTGPAKIKNIGLKIKPDKNILGVCTSSGIIGHSLSFGKAHAVTVLSHDTLFADATATALCNECKKKDPVLIEEVLKKYFIDGIIGAIVIYDDYFGCIGDIPDICETDIDYKLIAK
jgi:uncharacterized protein